MAREQYDPNYVAYQKDLADGKFNKTKRHAYVAYSRGKLKAKGKLETVFNKLDANAIDGAFVHQLGTDDEVIEM